MKKLLYIALLLLPLISRGQSQSVAMQFRRMDPQVNTLDSVYYTFPGKLGGYSWFWNAAKIRDYVATVSGPTYTFINGLQSYGSNNIGLGGTIDGFASIDLTDGSSFAMQSPQANFSMGHDLRFGQGLTNISQIVLSDDNATFALNSSSTNEQQSINAIPGLITMSYVKAGTSLAANISIGNTTQPIVFTDHIANAGPIAGGNYEANYTSKSYTSRRYVDSVSTASSSNKLDTTGKALNAKRDFAAKGNSKVVTDVVTNGTSTITSASANFVSTDAGKTIGIAYGGTDTLTNNVRKPFRSTIVMVNSSTSVTLANAVPATISGPRTITGVSMSAFSNIVTCSGCTMTQNDKGKQVVIPGVGPINNQTASHSTGTFPIDSNSTCYIYAVTSSTTFLVTKKALFSTSGRTVALPGAWAVYGNDDTAPLNNAVTAAIASKKKLEIPEGKYLTTGAINTASNLTVEGYGAGSSIIYPVGTGFSALVANHAASDTIARNVHFRYFEIDGMALGSNTYDHTMKGILILPAIDFSLEYVTIRNCPATGFGSDFMKNYLIIGSKFIHNGRQGFEFQSIFTIAGSAGVGIGTGKWQDEGGLITGCYADNNFSNNYFWEGQERGQFAGGAKAIGNYSTFANGTGYGNIGTDGMNISTNYSIYDGTGIRSDQSPYQTASNLTYERNGLYNGNIIRNSFGTPFTLLTKYGGQHISNNDIENTLPMPSTAGVKLISTDSTGNNIREIVFQGNKIKGIRGDGVSIETGNASETHGSVVITGNTLVDNGLSNASPGAAIVLKGKTLNLFVRGNIAFDDRLTTSRTQAYGFYVPAAQTTTAFFYGENSFSNNITAPDLYTNLTTTSDNIGQSLIKNAGPTVLSVIRKGTSQNVTIGVGDDGGTATFMGKSSAANIIGFGPTADINGAGTVHFNVSTGRAGFGGVNTPTAAIHIRAGVATANGAPLKFTSGVNLTTPEAGAIEWDGARMYATSTTGPTRNTIAYLSDVTGLVDNVLPKSASYTIVSGDFASGKTNVLRVLVDVTSASATITFPAASGLTGKVIYVTKKDASANTITISGVLGTASLITQYQSLNYYSDGTNWYPQ